METQSVGSEEKMRKKGGKRTEFRAETLGREIPGDVQTRRTIEHNTKTLRDFKGLIFRIRY